MGDERRDRPDRGHRRAPGRDAAARRDPGLRTDPGAGRQRGPSDRRRGRGRSRRAAPAGALPTRCARHGAAREGDARPDRGLRSRRRAAGRSRRPPTRTRPRNRLARTSRPSSLDSNPNSIQGGEFPDGRTDADDQRGRGASGRERLGDPLLRAGRRRCPSRTASAASGATPRRWSGSFRSSSWPRRAGFTLDQIKELLKSDHPRDVLSAMAARKLPTVRALAERATAMQGSATDGELHNTSDWCAQFARLDRRNRRRARRTAGRGVSSV